MEVSKAIFKYHISIVSDFIYFFMFVLVFVFVL